MVWNRKFAALKGKWWFYSKGSDEVDKVASTQFTLRLSDTQSWKAGRGGFNIFLYQEMVMEPGHLADLTIFRSDMDRWRWRSLSTIKLSTLFPVCGREVVVLILLSFCCWQLCWITREKWTKIFPRKSTQRTETDTDIKF